MFGKFTMNRTSPLYILRNNVLSRVTAILVLDVCKKYTLYALFYAKLCIPKSDIIPLYIIKNCKLDVCKNFVRQIAIFAQLA